MSRGHVQGYDSNAGQFERMGNPWVTNRDRQELGNFPISRKAQRQNRQVRPCDRPYCERKAEARALTPEEQRAKRQREMLLHVLRLTKQARGGETREVAGYRPVEPPAKVIRPSREKPISEWDHEKIAGDLARLQREHERALAEARSDEPMLAHARRELGSIAL